MPIITLTTDMGTKDYYVGALKGTALSMFPEVNIIDISHSILPFNLTRAAFVLRNAWHNFPAGTVHVVSVGNEWSKESPYVAVKKDGHFFIGTDNGLFSLLFDSAPDEMVRIKLSGEEELSFPGKSIFMPAAVTLCKSGNLLDVGEEIPNIKRRPLLAPVTDSGLIRGSVIYIDSYGNIITNITKELFERTVGHNKFTIYVSRGEYDLNTISRVYNEVPDGELVAIFNSVGHLEIAINKGVEGNGGGASGLLGMRENDTVRIEFESGNGAKVF